jgi:hypothetical protein
LTPPKIKHQRLNHSTNAQPRSERKRALPNCHRLGQGIGTSGHVIPKPESDIPPQNIAVYVIGAATMYLFKNMAEPAKKVKIPGEGKNRSIRSCGFDILFSE